MLTARAASGVEKWDNIVALFNEFKNFTSAVFFDFTFPDECLSFGIKSKNGDKSPGAFLSSRSDLVVVMLKQSKLRVLRNAFVKGPVNILNDVEIKRHKKQA